mmetsp:Transcript_20938/g.45804  ORF Transcript_20938/g.45804 Transcript_20938/m.45804 type:complete len:98 (-) Transcript_20938:406-699(-)
MACSKSAVAHTTSCSTGHREMLQLPRQRASSEILACFMQHKEMLWNWLVAAEVAQHVVIGGFMSHTLQKQPICSQVEAWLLTPPPGQSWGCLSVIHA